MIPTKGRIVLVEFLNDQPMCNNDRVHPAVVTHSFASEDGPQYINVKVLTDGPQPAIWLTSIGRKDRATPTRDAAGTMWPAAVWYWPPKDGEAVPGFAAPQVAERADDAATTQAGASADSGDVAADATETAAAADQPVPGAGDSSLTDGSAAGEKPTS
jgi:hypothetical protein